MRETTGLMTGVFFNAFVASEAAHHLATDEIRMKQLHLFL